MKRRFTTVLVVVLLTITSTFANTNNNKTENVNQRVESSFNKHFSDAEQVSWTRVDKLYKAQFTLHGRVMYAVMDEDGTLVGAYRNILSTQLPIPLMNQLKDEYNDYWISALFEVAKENETSYYVTVENKDQSLILKSENGDSWTTFSKVRK
jgi:hypothetical protein